MAKCSHNIGCDIGIILREIEKNVPKNLDVHIIVNNYATHKHLRVKRWFATRP
jgi:putative transposase